MFNIIKTVFQALALVVAVVGIVERPGDGATKKKEVMKQVKEQLPKLVPLPSWVSELFLREVFLSWVIDLVVWVSNQYGFFAHTENGGES